MGRESYIITFRTEAYATHTFYIGNIKNMCCKLKKNYYLFDEKKFEDKNRKSYSKVQFVSVYY